MTVIFKPQNNLIINLIWVMTLALSMTSLVETEATLFIYFMLKEE